MGKNVKTFRWDQRLQIQTFSWHLNRFPDADNIEKIPSTGIELMSQRVKGYEVPLSYRGDRLCWVILKTRSYAGHNCVFFDGFFRKY